MFTMGLYVMPKFENCVPGDVYTVEDYFHYLEATNSHISFKDWYEAHEDFSKEKLISVFTPEMIEFYKAHYHEFNIKGLFGIPIPTTRIAEDYTSTEWDNAFHIYNWLLSHTNKVDGWCMVSKNNVEELLSICTEILNDPNKAMELLPLNEGEGEYDKMYYRSIKDSIPLLNKILENVDFDNYMINFDFD